MGYITLSSFLFADHFKDDYIILQIQLLAFGATSLKLYAFNISHTRPCNSTIITEKNETLMVIVENVSISCWMQSLLAV